MPRVAHGQLVLRLGRLRWYVEFGLLVYPALAVVALVTANLVLQEGLPELLDLLLIAALVLADIVVHELAHAITGVVAGWNGLVHIYLHHQPHVTSHVKQSPKVWGLAALAGQLLSLAFAGGLWWASGMVVGRETAGSALAAAATFSLTLTVIAAFGGDSQAVRRWLRGGGGH